jgi:hypothetical protein
MTTYAPASACGPGCLPRAGTVPRVGWPVRVARLLAMLLVLLAGIGFALSQPLLSLSGRARITRAWFRCLLAASGVRLVITGGPPLSANRATGDRGTLVVANHVSWLDIPAVLAVEGMRVPQGRFYPATFQAAIDANAGVRPVSLRYRLTDGTPTTVAAFVGADSLVASVLRVVATRGLVVELDAGPIADAHRAARRNMATRTADLIRLTARQRQPGGRIVHTRRQSDTSVSPSALA